MSPDTPATTARTVCPACGAALGPGDNFCESCGAALGTATDAVPVPGSRTPADDLSPISTPTAVRPPRRVEPGAARACAECGAPVGDDGYCTVCGTKAPSARDHFARSPASWVAGVCDRGVTHIRNEDAMALLADEAPGSRAVLVVCDGVSSSDGSDVAALAAAEAALDVLRTPMPRGVGVPASADAAATRVLTQAAAAANTAVIAHTDPSSPRPASCTFAVGVVEGDLLRYAVIGDSRVYLLPDEGAGTQLLTDDSMAQALIDGGMPRAEAEQSPQAHAITKWLGVDSPDIVPRCGSRTVTGPGWLLVCSDGLWNYASEPAQLQAQFAAAATAVPAELAQALVDWAIGQGGHDNITVTLARVGQNACEDDEREPHG